MGKIKSFLIGCIDNKLDPVYTLDQVVKHKVKYEEITKEKKSSSKGSYNKSSVQVQKGSKP